MIVDLVSLVRWSDKRPGWTGWHAVKPSDRQATRCDLRLPTQAKVRRRLAMPGQWPRHMCDACKRAS